ncbi:chemotaxis signal transduction protein [Marmoricola sp. URHA0025 HA25]
MKVMSMTMVCFRTPGATYCLPLDVAVSVRTSEDLVPLPDPAPEVAGIIPGSPPLTVMSPFRSTGAHVIVVEADGKRFGLLVDEVTGLRHVEAGDIRPAPAGQVRALVSGTVDTDGQLIFVADPIALAGRL